MTPERSQAYGRLMKTIAASGEGALDPAEQAVLREAGHRSDEHGHDCRPAHPMSIGASVPLGC